MWPLSPKWRDPLTAPGRIAVSGTGLRVRLLGEAARSVVFIHGLGASLRYWGTAYDQLAGRSRLVFVDLLGFGGSEKPIAARYDIAGHAERIADALREFGAERPLLVGHSTGGIVAMALAAHDLPESSVIGHFTADFKQENDDHVLERARQLAADDERAAEIALFEQIVSRTDEGGKGVLGMDDTLLALVEGQVDTIAVEGLTQEGSQCLNCDYLSAHKFRRCPICSGTECADLADVIEKAIERAYSSGSRVNIVFDGAEELLQSRGGIGALLRYVPARRAQPSA